MKSIQAAALFICALIPCAASFAAVTIETVPVGDIGNPDDSADGDGSIVDVQSFGGVSYTYNIGKYEVTLGQYTAFLNAVAATDAYSLYYGGLAGDQNVAGILRGGSSGSYVYSVIGSPNHPVTYVSWGDAARFANWLHNGQPTGSQDATTTEDGAYTLNGATTSAALMAVTRNANAKWGIPTENEWYKAAYYQPAAAGGDSDGYWTYPLKSNSAPYSDQPPGITPDNSRVANFVRNDITVNGYNDGYAVTGLTTFDNNQNYLTDVGAYTLSTSYYGTFDQAGNVYEWNEGLGNIDRRVGRGGAWGSSSGSMAPLNRVSFEVIGKSDDLGFRVVRIAATVPEPTAILLATFGIVSLLWWHRR